MKKRSLTNITVVALLVVLLTLIAVSGTYAKYTTTVTGTGNAIVAKWAFSASADGQTALEDNFVINLVDTATEGVITGLDGNKKIAPGTKGEFTLTIDNTASDVAADLTVEASNVDGLPLTNDQFTCSVASLTVDGTAATSVPAGKTAIATISWGWTYSVSDAADLEDTTAGEGAVAEAIELINLTVIGTQAQ